MSSVRFENVMKSFSGRAILDGVSYEIEKGEIFYIIGPSGTGKSVSLKHMVRLITPDSGSVWIGDSEISSASGKNLEELRSKIGFLFQGGALLAWMNVQDNIALPLREKTKLSEEKIRKKVQRVLELVGMPDDGEKTPSEISGGMQKRVGLARAIVEEPDIVLYDEPTSGLDPVTARKIDKLIVDMRDQTGVTSIVVTHDLHSALSTADRIAMLYQGKLVELSTPKEFIKSKVPEVQEFLSSQYITKRGVWEEGLSV